GGCALVRVDQLLRRRGSAVGGCAGLVAGEPDDESLVADDEVVDELANVPVGTRRLLGPLVLVGPSQGGGHQVLSGLELSDVHAQDSSGCSPRRGCAMDWRQRVW